MLKFRCVSGQGAMFSQPLGAKMARFWRHLIDEISSSNIRSCGQSVHIDPQSMTGLEGYAADVSHK